MVQLINQFTNKRIKQIPQKMIRQNPLTLVTPVKNGEHDNLEALLTKIRNDIINGLPQQFEGLNTIHYARWVFWNPKMQTGNHSRTWVFALFSLLISMAMKINIFQTFQQNAPNFLMICIHIVKVIPPLAKEHLRA